MFMFMFKYPFDTKFFVKFLVMVELPSNPYSSLLDRNPSKIFTRGTEKRNRRMQTEIAASEFDAQLALMQYENEYNSPLEKTKRNAVAGINSDLAGIDGGSDSVSSSDAVTGLANSITTDNPIEKARMFASGLQSVFDNAMSVYSQYQDMRSRTIDNDIKQMQLFDHMYTTANLLGIKDNHASVPIYDPITGYATSISLAPLSKRTPYKPVSLSRKASAAFNKYLDYSAFDILNEYKGRQEYHDTRKQYFSAATSANYAGLNDDEIYDAMTATNNFLFDVDNVVKGALKSKSIFDQNYYDNLSGSSYANYDTSIKKYGALSSQREYNAGNFDATFDKMKNDYLSKLYKSANSGDMFSKILLNSLLIGRELTGLADKFSFNYNNINSKPSRYVY